MIHASNVGFALKSQHRKGKSTPPQAQSWCLDLTEPYKLAECTLKATDAHLWTLVRSAFCLFSLHFVNFPCSQIHQPLLAAIKE